MALNQEKTLREIKDSLIKERDSSIANFNKLIEKVQKQIDLVCADDYLEGWKQWLKISFNKSNEEAFDKWFRKQITLEDITMIRGSFYRNGEKIKVLTCGYLRNEILYFYTNLWDEFQDAIGNKIKPNALYPENIKDVEECRRAFLKLKKEVIATDVNKTEDAIKCFIMVYCFLKMISEFGAEKHEPYCKEDFSFMS